MWADPPQAIWTQNRDQPGSHKYPGTRDADIWVFSGQSNSQGWGMVKAPTEPNPRVLFFRADNQWVVAREPLNPQFTHWDPDPVDQNILLQRTGVESPDDLNIGKFVTQMNRDKVVLGGAGMGLAFAKHLLRFIDKPLGLVYCGVGGSSIKSWNPAEKESNYEQMLRRIAIVGGKIKGLVWYQGETDAMAPGGGDTYQAAVLELFDRIRQDTGIPELPILCVQLGRFVWNYDSHGRDFERIRDIQRRLPALRSHVHTVSALDLPLEDPAHISFEGHQRLGRRLAEVALGSVYGLPQHSQGIALKDIQVLQPENQRPMVRVRFSGANGKLRAPGLPAGFELRSQVPACEPRGSTSDAPLPVIYRIDFDPTDPAALILGICDNTLLVSGGATFHPLRPPFSIVYGPGMNPYVNIVDEKDIPLPAFGPVEVTHL